MKRIRGSRTAALASIALWGLAAGAGARSARAEDAPATPPAAAPPARGPADGFGVPGTLVVSAELQLGFSHQSRGNQSGTTFVIQPAGDYFVAPHISIGGRLGYGHSSSDMPVGPLTLSTTTSSFSLLVRGGYDLTLASQISVWPTLGIGYTHVSSETGNTSSSGHTIPLELDVPLLFHVVPHVFIGFGPFLSTELVSEANGANPDKITQFGFRSVIGGYFGL